jgi:hypothetical protein
MAVTDSQSHSSQLTARRRHHMPAASRRSRARQPTPTGSAVELQLRFPAHRIRGHRVRGLTSIASHITTLRILHSSTAPDYCHPSPHTSIHSSRLNIVMSSQQKAIVVRTAGGDLQFENIPKPILQKSNAQHTHSTVSRQTNHPTPAIIISLSSPHRRVARQSSRHCGEGDGSGTESC